MNKLFSIVLALVILLSLAVPTALAAGTETTAPASDATEAPATGTTAPAEEVEVETSGEETPVETTKKGSLMFKPTQKSVPTAPSSDKVAEDTSPQALAKSRTGLIVFAAVMVIAAGAGIALIIIKKNALKPER
jgi:hypothetical protein